MSNGYLTILCIVIFNSFFSKDENDQTYKIHGTVRNYSDSAVLYLSDLSDGSYKDIDSAMVLGERFEFKGVLENSIVKFAIHTKDFKDRVAFWVDNSETTISTEKGNFKNALIKGADAQEKQYELYAIISSGKNEKQDFVTFIQKNPSTIVSADLLKTYCSTWNRDTVSILYENLSAYVKNTIYGKRVFDFLTLNKNLKIGDKSVDFEQVTMDGKVIKLSDYHGKILLLEFWGSWCGPCREGHPKLIETYNQFKNKGFEILGIAADTERKMLLNAIQQDGLPWQNLSDLKGDQNRVALIYGISAYPTNFLIDRNGIIIAKNVRDQNLSKKLLELLQ